jgi:dihydroorotase
MITRDNGYGETDRIIMLRPDDWHLHPRDGAAMASVLWQSARVFGRALIMPNLKPPVTTVASSAPYRERILATLPAGSTFEPLMTLYLTDNTTPKDVEEAAKSGFVKAFKLYPVGATTNSDAGVTDIAKVKDALAAMEKYGLRFCVHGEMLRDAFGEFDIFDREAYFIDRILTKIVKEFPGLKIVLEHVTTKDGVDFVRVAGPNVAATITAHHLLLNRNAIFKGGINPHHFCLPVLKREEHRQALLLAATSGHPKYFSGTDSAPHAKGAKESACGCAGCYTAHAAMGLYAEAFESVGAIDRLEGFASHFGADFYGLPRNTDRIMLVKEPLMIPKELPFGDDVVVPFRAGETVAWQVKDLDYPG